MKELLRRLFPEGSTGRWTLLGFRSHPIKFFSALLRSLLATRKLTGSFFPLRVRIGVGQRLEVERSPSAATHIEANIFASPQLGNQLTSSIKCGENSNFTVLGDFVIGPGVHIEIAKEASLKLHGRKVAGSGVTCNSRISAEKHIEIGSDCIIAWDVFITDSDWHNVKGAARKAAVSIGDKVWISHGVSILKGVRIPSGCIVGAKSLVTRGDFPEKSLIAGSPAVVRRTEVEWSW